MTDRSSRIFYYWGKARPQTDEGAQFHLLPYHSLDVAAVGCSYVRRASSLRALLMRWLQIEDEATLERWLAFWLSLHDLGKFAESFQGQKPELFRDLRGRFPDASKIYKLRHDSVGMLFWRDVLGGIAEKNTWFGPQTGPTMAGLDCWMRAVTGHHGQPPKNGAGDDWTQHFDRREDHLAVLAFADEMRAMFVNGSVVSVISSMDTDSFRRTSVELSWWIAGLTVLADWLGSNTEFFPYRADPDRPLPLADYWELANEQAVRALDASGVLGTGPSEALSFTELFPGIHSPSPLQEWASNVDVSDGPQVYLLEDVTGAGKTEAAVMLAHRLMTTGRADGFFIGLPTMATANAMYGRIAQVYDRLFREHASLALAHGQRNLVEDFAATVLPADADENDPQQADETASARCTAWLADHNKRALLAPAGVGTLDQALLAVLHSKHQSLRLLGLFRKVLVVDEVHACDAYMQGVLEILLKFHARAGGSAILLSATLPRRMKQSLLDAFARGCRSTVSGVSIQAYPLVTRWSSGAPAELSEVALQTREDVRRTLAVRYVSNEADVVTAIEDSLAAGKCVCWIRNTVADALSAHAKFQGRMPADKLTLFHARFVLADRLRIEGRILSLFGKYSTPELRRGQLVIATQVAEQSLDADWDMVVSDLAPIDRLIQRAGRLQRHPRDKHGRRLDDPTARDQRGGPCLWVLGPEWTIEPPANWFEKMFPKAAAIYSHHGQLWLTAKVLRIGKISMPGDARELIESVFGDAMIPDGLQSNAVAAEGRGYANASVAQQNTVKLELGYVRSGIDWWSEAKTPSRLGEPMMNVLLARWDGEYLRPWIEGRSAWAYSTVRVAERLIAHRKEQSTPENEAAVQRLFETLPDKGQWCVLLVLRETSRGWIGEAWGRAAKADVSRTWIYQPSSGLTELDAPVETSTGAIPD